MTVIGVDVGIERPGIDHYRYGRTSAARISSIRSEMSCRPLLPCPGSPQPTPLTQLALDSFAVSSEIVMPPAGPRGGAGRPVPTCIFWG